MNRLRTFYRKYNELVNYSAVGVSNTVLTLAVYFVLARTLLSSDAAVELQIANMVSWFCGTLYSYCTNRRFVFHSHNPHVLREAFSFFLSRLFALVLDMAVMFLMVTLLALSDVWAKVASVAVQTVSNYVLSKFLVFHHRARRKEKIP